MKGFEHSSSYFKSTKDGFPIYRRKWTPVGGKPPERVIVLQHGFGEHSGRYGFLLEKLASTRTAVYALDSRGHGETGGIRGHVDQFQMYVDDLSDLILLARKENNNQKVFLLGHSLGGVICLQYSTQSNHQENIRSLIISSAGIYPVMDTVKYIKRTLGQFLALVFPATTVDAGLDTSLLSHDTKVVEAYNNDPLVHGKISMQMGKNFFEVGEALVEKAERLTVPTFLFHGADDGIVDARSSEVLYEKLKQEDRKLSIYPGLYHETMNESPADRETVLGEVRDWIMNH